jgi:hypothetical protein
VTAGAFTGSDASPAFAREERRTQFQDNISMVMGSHLLKAGGDIQLVRSVFEDLFAAGGQYTFDALDDFLANNPSRFVQRFNTKSNLSNNVVGFVCSGCVEGPAEPDAIVWNAVGQRIDSG